MWHFVRTFVISLIVVLVLQIHIHGVTIEQRAIALASHSAILAPVEGVVEASVISIHRSWDQITNHIKSRAFRPGSRETKFQIERHPDAVKKKSSTESDVN